MHEKSWCGMNNTRWRGNSWAIYTGPEKNRNKIMMESWEGEEEIGGGRKRGEGRREWRMRRRGRRRIRGKKGLRFREGNGRKRMMGGGGRRVKSSITMGYNAKGVRKGE